MWDWVKIDLILIFESGMARLSSLYIRSDGIMAVDITLTNVPRIEYRQA